MQEKLYYRDYFLNVQKYLKFSKILDELNVSKSNYYQFVKNFERKNDLFSIEMLEKIKNHTEYVISMISHY